MYFAGSVVLIPAVLLTDSYTSEEELEFAASLINTSEALPRSVITRSGVAAEIEERAKQAVLVVYSPPRTGTTQVMMALKDQASEHRDVLMVQAREQIKAVLEMRQHSELRAMGTYKLILNSVLVACNDKKAPLVIIDHAEQFEGNRLYHLTTFINRMRKQGYNLVFCTNDLAFYYRNKQMKAQLFTLPPLTLLEFTAVAGTLSCVSQLSAAELSGIAGVLYEAVGPDLQILEQFISQEASVYGNAHAAFIDNLLTQYQHKLQEIVDKIGSTAALASCLDGVSEQYPHGCTFLGTSFGRALIEGGVGREDLDGLVSFKSPLVVKAARCVLSKGVIS